MQENNSFAQKLKALRKSKGITQEKLAELLNISIMTIRRWEWGVHTPRMDEIKRLAKALGVDENDLLNDTQQASGWVLTVKIAQELQEEVINVGKNIPTVASIITTPAGGYLCLGGDYSKWTDNDNFKRFIADIKKFRNTVIQNGIALGGIKS